MTFSPLVPPLGEARVFDWLRHSLLKQAELEPITIAEVEAAAQAKRDPHFDELRNARLRMGHLRYGTCGRNLTDVIGSAITRLQKYQVTGNREHLVDAANLCEIEWIWPQKEGTYFESLDSAQDAHAQPVQSVQAVLITHGEKDEFGVCLCGCTWR